MLLRCAFLSVVAPLCVSGQTACPSANFLAARIANLKPAANSHLDVLRQSDGSWTGYEITDSPDHRTLNVTPHFERQFAACLPHPVPAVPLAPETLSKPIGAGSQPVVSMTLKIGNVFVANMDALGVLYFDLFDPKHNLLSETSFTYSAPEEPGSRGDFFRSLTLADMDNDGNTDLIGIFDTNRISGSIQGGVWVFPGNGDGTFRAGKRTALHLAFGLNSPAAGTGAVADLNGDGKIDVLLPNPSTGKITIALGNGDGTFGSATTSFSIPPAGLSILNVSNG